MPAILLLGRMLRYNPGRRLHKWPVHRNRLASGFIVDDGVAIEVVVFKVEIAGLVLVFLGLCGLLLSLRELDGCVFELGQDVGVQVVEVVIGKVGHCDSVSRYFLIASPLAQICHRIVAQFGRPIVSFVS